MFNNSFESFANTSYASNRIIRASYRIDIQKFILFFYKRLIKW